ncbi:Lar family restriction alleviation protein [Afipia clevelandensis]|uniref:Restriction alleviation protein, Lar family n=1 Tax=Afipia clevelandensis ATCC 49720 TaxID=883079 RepID=K8PDW0_9BRAD|nr:Lar family restriction alleviation protein [Afipia clevelandensis]EKS37740.1 hypothetical protein HMPREF9696_01690 [Afipia clevelandensis ATCC 49720]
MTPYASATKLPKIKPCPFCGSEPETMGSGDGQRGLMIQCIGADCPNPHASYYDHGAAIAVWNRRANSVREPT